MSIPGPPTTAPVTVLVGSLPPQAVNPKAAKAPVAARIPYRQSRLMLM
jgi:hypothetical protein